MIRLSCQFDLIHLRLVGTKLKSHFDSKTAVLDTIIIILVLVGITPIFQIRHDVAVAHIRSHRGVGLLSRISLVIVHYSLLPTALVFELDGHLSA